MTVLFVGDRRLLWSPVTSWRCRWASGRRLTWRSLEIKPAVIFVCSECPQDVDTLRTRRSNVAGVFTHWQIITLRVTCIYLYIGATWQIRLTCACFGPLQSTTQTAIRSVQPFLHRSRQKVSIQWAPLSTRIAPSHGKSRPHLTHHSLRPCEPTTQTTPRSVQTVLHRWPQSVHYVQISWNLSTKVGEIVRYLQYPF